MFWRSPMYYVHLDRVWEHRDGNGSSNFRVFKDKRAAVQCLKKNPKYGQIDVRGHKVEPYCWLYWQRGRIVKNNTRYSDIFRLSM